MIAVIGGGAAGMMAAVAARESGAAVTLIEQNRICGKKLLITGKGRCNVTNACPTEDIFGNIPTNAKFMYSAVYGFTNFDVIDFFESNNVPIKIERGERVFPQSDKAADIVAALEHRMAELGVVKINARAEKISTANGAVCGVLAGGRNIEASSVILASGGKSYPRTGSDGTGYRMAAELGHTIKDISPALVPVETLESTQELMGLSLKNVTLCVTDCNGRRLFEQMGELLFTHFGLSGPLVLSSSSHMGKNPCGYCMEIDLKPALDEQKLEARILRDFEKYINRNFENSLSELLPVKLIDFIIKRSQIDRYKKVNSITKEERKRLLQEIKHLKFTVKSFRPVEEAIVTSGGISVREIDPTSMESKLVKNLYFAGEIIDVDAYTGGFNLQLAFSGGHLAGKSAAERENAYDQNCN